MLSQEKEPYHKKLHTLLTNLACNVDESLLMVQHILLFVLPLTFPVSPTIQLAWTALLPSWMGSIWPTSAAFWQSPSLTWMCMRTKPCVRTDFLHF